MIEPFKKVTIIFGQFQNSHFDVTVFVNVLKIYIGKVDFPLVSWQDVTQPFFFDTNKAKINTAAYIKHLRNQLFPNLTSFIPKRNTFSPRTKPVPTQRSLHKAT